MQSDNKIGMDGLTLEERKDRLRQYYKRKYSLISDGLLEEIIEKVCRDKPLDNENVSSPEK